jgi:gliding motility-associated-like protein
MIEPTKLVLTGSKTDVTCSYNKDGRITLNANNTGTSNYTYEVVRISNGQTVSQSNVPSFTFTGLDSGMYNSFVTDRNGCKESLTGLNALSIGKPSPLKPKINVTPASCLTSNNGSLRIDTLNAGSNGGYRAITTLTPNFTDPKTGLTPNMLKGLESYRVIVSDRLGCTDTQTVFVDTVYELRITAALKMDSVSCFGGNDGKLTLNINSLVPNNGGLDFQWDDANSTKGNNVLTASAGTYNLTVTDGNKCSASTLGTIEEPAPIVIVGKMKEVSCYKGEDGTVKIAVAGGRPPYQYAWSPLNQNTDSAIGLKAGINTVTVTDSKNCQNTQSFDMPQPVPFIAHIDTVKHISCFGANDGKIVLRIEGGKPQFTYTWNLDTRNAASIDNLMPNISYKVTVTDILGCIAKAETEVKEPFKVELESLIVDSLTCPKSNDGRISIQVKGGTITAINQYDYSIDGGTTYEKTNVFEKLPAGEYTVLAKDNNGCMVTKKVTVLAPEELFVSAKINGLDTIEMGNSTELYYDKRTLSNNFPIINSQLWTPNESLSCANCARTQAMPYISETYNLEVYYHKNCKATSKVKVMVKEPLDFYVPNAFSPGNQDGVNDVLKLYGNSIKSIKFAVFNRWGEKVFESETQEKSWDGNYKGEPAPSGTYTYVAEVTYLNNLVKNKKGSVTLIR